MAKVMFSEEDLKSYLYGKLQSESIDTESSFLPPLVPRQVCIQRSSIPGSSFGVFSKLWIRRGTEMGPYTGRLFAEIDNSVHNKNTWEVFDERGEVVFYVDGGSDLYPSSWLTCVQCARSDREQNLELTQIDRHIFYRAIKDIAPGEELLVWYGQSSIYHMGLPMTSQPTSSVSKISRCISGKEEKCIEQHPTLMDNVDKLKCVLCRRGFNSRSNLRSHMRIHTMEKPFTCKFCNKCFSQSSTLRNHVRLHTGEKPYKCYVCRSSYSQLAGLRAHQRSARHKPIPVTTENMSTDQ